IRANAHVCLAIVEKSRANYERDTSPGQFVVSLYETTCEDGGAYATLTPSKLQYSAMESISTACKRSALGVAARSGRVTKQISRRTTGSTSRRYLNTFNGWAWAVKAGSTDMRPPMPSIA